MREKKHEFDFCVVGGGMAGLLAAIAAARKGVNCALVQDRPVLGGNASSEIRMHICGAHGANLRETGILEELSLENLYRNPNSNYSIWDSVLYGKAQYQENLTLFLNCSVNDCVMKDAKIASIKAWQLTTETHHEISATLFADCSGDGILAPLSGADFRIGREAREEFGETIPPVKSDKKTMGLSCLLQVREYDTPQEFINPTWAHQFTCKEDLQHRGIDFWQTNFWWIEVGGEWDSIHDTERCREELLKISFGVWNYIKNYSELKEHSANWNIDWMGFLPGKRESRRYLGEHILTQGDIESEGKFNDLVAYGGWSMDDHFPAGFYHPQKGTIFHPSPSPFGIPYRSLYSRNIQNLFCAGRCHSATHAAMSATRVMATTSLMGQAVGTAAAIAIKENLTPHEVYENKIEALRQNLLEDDCYLPWALRKIPELSTKAQLSASSGDPNPLLDGVDRSVADDSHSWTGDVDDWIEYRWEKTSHLSEIRIVFDSDLSRPGLNMKHYYPKNSPYFNPPKTLVKNYQLEIEKDGSWELLHEETSNYQRLVRIPIDVDTKAIRLIAKETWGAEKVCVFAFDIR